MGRYCISAFGGILQSRKWKINLFHVELSIVFILLLAVSGNTVASGQLWEDWKYQSIEGGQFFLTEDALRTYWLNHRLGGCPPQTQLKPTGAWTIFFSTAQQEIEHKE